MENVLIRDASSPYNTAQILSDLINNHDVYSITSDMLDHGNGNNSFISQVIYLHNGVSNHLLDFCEDFVELAEKIKQEVDILFKYKLNFAHQSAYSSGSANVNFGILHAVLLKKIKRFFLSCPMYLIYNTAQKGCVLFTCEVENYLMKVFDTFVSFKCVEAI